MEAVLCHGRRHYHICIVQLIVLIEGEVLPGDSGITVAGFDVMRLREWRYKLHHSSNIISSCYYAK
jgi:hypothetical protein